MSEYKCKHGVLYEHPTEYCPICLREAMRGESAVSASVDLDNLQDALGAQLSMAPTPWQWSRGRLECANGNDLPVCDVVPYLNLTFEQLPALLSEVRRLRARNAKLTKALEEISDMYDDPLGLGVLNPEQRIARKALRDEGERS